MKVALGAGQQGLVSVILWIHMDKVLFCWSPFFLLDSLVTWHSLPLDILLCFTKDGLSSTFILLINSKSFSSTLVSYFSSLNVHKNHSVKVQILILQSWWGPRVCILIGFQVMLPAQVSPMDGPDDANGSAHELHLEEQAAREVLFIIAYLLFLDLEFSDLPKDFESQN